jgi:hypothetical protein
MTTTARAPGGQFTEGNKAASGRGKASKAVRAVRHAQALVGEAGVLDLLATGVAVAAQGGPGMDPTLTQAARTLLANALGGLSAGRHA